MAATFKNITTVGKASFRAGNYSPLGEFDATVSVTEADDVLSASATVSVAGASAVTEADDAISAVAAVSVAGAVAATEADDTLSAVAAVIVAGSAAVAEADEILSAVGDVEPISGALLITEANDSLNASGSRTVAAGYRSPLPLAFAVTAKAAITDFETGGSVSGPLRVRLPHADGLAPGELLVVQCSLVPGIAVVLIPGKATGVQDLTDEELMILLEAA